jgi:hypothetical protein
MSYKVYNWQLKMEVKHRLTQHKRFVPYGTHLHLRREFYRQANFCFAKTSFMSAPLYEMAGNRIK